MTRKEFEEEMRKWWEPERILYISAPTYRKGDFVIIYNDKDIIPNIRLCKGWKKFNEYIWQLPIKDISMFVYCSTHIAIALSGHGAIKIPGKIK